MTRSFMERHATAERSDFGTPIEWAPPCPCGAAIRFKGPIGAVCENDHLAHLSRGPVARLEWGMHSAAYPSLPHGTQAWKYTPRPKTVAEWDEALRAVGAQPLTLDEATEITHAVRLWDAEYRGRVK